MGMHRKTYAPELGNPPSWHERANCRDADPELFFPHPSDAAKHGRGATDAYCGPCPVRVECLQVALLGNEKGTWGGLTEPERQRLRTRIKPKHYATTESLKETIEVDFPECEDCHRHLKEKADGRCTECHRAHEKRQLELARAICSMEDCEYVVHAKGLCSKHYHAIQHMLNPGANAKRSREYRARKKEAAA